MANKNIGFAQLVLFNDSSGDDDDTAMGSIYSYRSLLLFRLLREMPINFRDARIIMRYLLSGLLIMGIHHPETRSPQKFVELVDAPGTMIGDQLKVSYILSKSEVERVDSRERAYVSAMRRMGALALRRVHPGHGSSIHYAGTLPFSETDTPFTLDPSGRLHGTKNVYVADGSGFTYLPAKGLTLSLMAQSYLVAKRIAEAR